ncbi:MAG TPA: iron-containing redox enzyme family protein [Actinophytocola sp.]|uniref:iron-containing redox enzyme family protein n=1 Tax=Actinophytocola sp. TaxID=1872138 RepID=UPI002DBF0744|nr:iron-containing redox enzyme family protein [Actinophytocola sp.]HEU5470218.1 iron-containing redox enzyme family protein [Actinophytocola sp.]
MSTRGDTMALATFRLPDRITSSALAAFEFSPGAGVEAAEILSGGPAETFQRIMRDQESEPVLLAARQILHAMLGEADGAGPDSADGIAAEVLAARAELAATAAELVPDESRRRMLLRERAPLALLAGCWLDMLSQPATQPSVIVNRLLQDHFVLKGEGNIQRSVQHVRHRELAESGIYLPPVGAEDFLRRAEVRPLTAAFACCYLALSRLPAAFLPEVVGVHYAFLALGTDDLLTGTPGPLPEPALRAALAEYLELTRDSVTGAADRNRLRAAVRLVLGLERAHVAMLAELAQWHDDLPLDTRVAAIVARHAPFAGDHHRGVRVRGRLLTETFADPEFDVAAFLDEFRRSRQVKPLRTGSCRFLDSIRFGGPMFGIFDEHEAATLAQWVRRAQDGDLPPIRLCRNEVGDDRAAAWRAAVAAARPADVRFTDAEPEGDRELLYRLVNIEHFANTLPLARQRAIEGLLAAEILFEHGARGRYTDASFFDYSPAALLDRVERIYWDKLMGPYRPLTDIPDRDEVIFGQTAFALGNLIDGAWAHRMGNAGRYHRRSDGLLLSIYLDEMGRGDLRKNHLTLIHQVLHNLSVPLPHIRDAAFRDQDLLPETHGQYESAIHQLCLSLFPDTFYNEILGYNLAIEMYGLGELRMHEIEKLRRHGLDTAYEEAHLSIDNISAGHSRQATDVITAYLDDVQRTLGAAAVPGEWRRIWRGYASFAYFAEHRLRRELAGTAAAADTELAI